MRGNCAVVIHKSAYVISVANTIITSRKAEGRALLRREDILRALRNLNRMHMRLC